MESETIAALFGFGGALVGSSVTAIKDLFTAKSNAERERQYLCVMVCGRIRAFIDSCANAALDDGTREGRPAGDNGYYEPQTKQPLIDIDVPGVDWKSLPPMLMQRAIDFPYLVSSVVSAIGDPYDYPPPFDEYLRARQYWYAVAGLHATILLCELQKVSDLKVQSLDGWWARETLLAQKQRYEEQQEVYRKSLGFDA